MVRGIDEAAVYNFLGRMETMVYNAEQSDSDELPGLKAALQAFNESMDRYGVEIQGDVGTFIRRA